MVLTNNLLVVDDEWVFLDSLCSMDEWADRNIKIIGTAQNGKEALKYVEEEKVDLMITDIHMPDMDGLELLKRTYEYNPNLPVIVVSGYERFSYAQTALRYQAKGFVLKPLDTDELFSIVDDLLGSSTASLSSNHNKPMTYHEEIVHRAIQYIQSNLDQPLLLTEIADMFHLTPHYFGQVFKKVTGVTFIEYLTKLRMEKACELLKCSNMKQYEICTNIGYNDPKYFSRVFNKYYGITPRKYRERARS